MVKYPCNKGGIFMPEDYILLVTNNTQKVNQLKKKLTSHGYQVVAVANDAYSGLRILRSQKVALSIIDYELPGLNGLQLARIMDNEKLGPLILISNYQIDFRGNLPLSIFGVLINPITEYQLINTIKLAISQYNIQKKLEKELDDLREQLEARKKIEKAKGIIMQKYKVTEDAAYKIIRQISMEKRKPMKKIAEAIILKEEGNKK